MLSNMESQLKQQGAGDKMDEVLEEVPRVRKDSGYPPLVTPTSQIVGTQAVLNVMMGKYKHMTGEFADLVLGYYGESIAEKDPAVIARASEHYKGNKPVITCRPADLLEPEWDKLKADALALEGNNGSDEDVLTYAMFPQVAPKFFATRKEGPKNVGKDPSLVASNGASGDPLNDISAPVNYLITYGGHSYKVEVAPGG
jgi:methylmalonyl-CoA carboxyltransferase 5S subunit